MRIFKFLNESAIRLTLAAGVGAAAAVAAMPLASLAEPAHGIAMYGEPALPAGFTHLPYVNPDAPKGGSIRLAESGSFDSLNPWILTGNAAWGVGTHVAETLLMRSIDEPFTLYGLLAEAVETDADRSWVEFTLRPEARFSDGSPVTVEDVMWSYETLGSQGHPRYLGAWSKIEKMEQTGDHKVKFTFNTADRELPLLMGMRPILKKAQWEGRDFTRPGLEVPIGSSPYVIDRVDPGRSLTFRRNPDYWGEQLAVNVGRHNLDSITYDYYSDNNAMFEAFKAGELDVWREQDPMRWDSYDFPRFVAGEVVKSEIPNERPSGIMGLVMNTRNPLFSDWRVRQAMIESFNWQFINATLSGGKDRRITSYFANSELAMQPGPAQGRVAELLAPHADDLPPGTIEGYELPEGGPQPLDRPAIRRAMKLMEEAGWRVENGRMTGADGQAFEFEILLNQSGSSMSTASEMKQMVDIYVEALKTLGIAPRVTMLDSAQYVERTNNYQFDMTWYDRGLSLSPGNEQRLYWGARGVTEPGSRNWMGIDLPAVEAIIDEMVNATGREDFIAATRALDRILTAGRYVIPVGYAPISRLAHEATLRFPEEIPQYGDWPGFLPETWWREPQ